MTGGCWTEAEGGEHSGVQQSRARTEYAQGVVGLVGGAVEVNRHEETRGVHCDGGEVRRAWDRGRQAMNRRKGEREEGEREEGREEQERESGEREEGGEEQERESEREREREAEREEMTKERKRREARTGYGGQRKE